MFKSDYFLLKGLFTVRDAGFKPWNTCSAVFCAINESRHIFSIKVKINIFKYLLCERNLPVAWPDPSQPGIGHLHIAFVLTYGIGYLHIGFFYTWEPAH